MSKISKQKAEELIALIQENRIVEVFEVLQSYKDVSITKLRQEYIHGDYKYDFYERLQALMNAMAETHFEVKQPHYDIFFSFSSKEIAEASEQVRILRKNGLAVFFSNEALRHQAGENFSDIINQALEYSTHFILHSTQAAMQSSWVKKEYQLFYRLIHLKEEAKRKFFILKGSDFTVESLPFELKLLQSTDLEDILANLGIVSPETKQIKQLQKENQELQIENDILKEKQTTLEQKNSQLRREIVNLELTLEEEERNKHRLELSLKQYESKLQETTEHKQNLNASFDKKLITLRETELRAVVEALQRTRVRLTQKENELQALQAKLNEAEKGLQEAINQKPKTIEIPTIIKAHKGKDYKETIKGVSFDMIWVEGGKFNFQGEKSIHLDGFYIGKYPVTQELYGVITGENPSHFRGRPHLPVEKVSWFMAKEFTDKLSGLTGNLYHLPTEAQWEYAIKGGQQSKGYRYAGSNDIKEVAWYGENSEKKTQPVGRLKPNELGIYDMSGNVWEWCLDIYYNNVLSLIPDNFSNPLNIDNVVFNHLVDTYSLQRDKESNPCLRGGSWNIVDNYCAVSFRHFNDARDVNNSYGFRLSRTP